MSDQTEEFVKLLGRTHRYRYVYLMSMMNDRDAVDEVMQETNLVLWREFDSFKPGTNFTAWSCRVAFNQMRAWRKKQQRSRLRFSEEFLNAMASELSKESDALPALLTALRNCTDRLPSQHQELLKRRYALSESIDTIAAGTQRSTDAVYRMLSRIRQALRSCVTETLSEG